VGSNAQVFWNVGSDISAGGFATLGANANIVGIIIA
jgi:hypothetical protein